MINGEEIITQLIVIGVTAVCSFGLAAVKFFYSRQERIKKDLGAAFEKIRKLEASCARITSKNCHCDCHKAIN